MGEGITMIFPAEIMVMVMIVIAGIPMIEIAEITPTGTMMIVTGTEQVIGVAGLSGVTGTSRCYTLC